MSATSVQPLLSQLNRLEAGEVRAWGPVLVLLAMVLALVVGLLVLSALVGPRRPGPVKNVPYESGVEPLGEARRRFNVRYYLIALLFLLFDVEIVLLFPWAALFGGPWPDYRTGPMLAAMALFVAILAIGYVYAWRRDVLRFD